MVLNLSMSERDGSRLYQEREMSRTDSAVLSIAANPYLPQYYNADRFIYLPELGAFGVFDGAAKELLGRRASELSRKGYLDSLAQLHRAPNLLSHENQVVSSLENGWTYSMTNLKKFTDRYIGLMKFKSLNDDNNSQWNLTTTATVGQLFEHYGEPRIIMAHGGDSRAFVLYEDGNVFQTPDEAWLEKYRQEQVVTEIQAQVIQTLVDEADDSGLVEKTYVMQDGQVVVTENLDEISNLLTQGGLDLTQFIYTRKYLHNGIADDRFRKDGRIRRLVPNLYNISLKDAYALAFFTDGIMDNMKTSSIINLISNLKKGARPKDILEELMAEASSSVYKQNWPKISADDKTGIIVAL